MYVLVHIDLIIPPSLFPSHTGPLVQRYRESRINTIQWGKAKPYGLRQSNSSPQAKHISICSLCPSLPRKRSGSSGYGARLGPVTHYLHQRNDPLPSLLSGLDRLSYLILESQPFLSPLWFNPFVQSKLHLKLRKPKGNGSHAQPISFKRIYLTWHCLQPRYFLKSLVVPFLALPPQVPSLSSLNLFLRIGLSHRICFICFRGCFSVTHFVEHQVSILAGLIHFGVCWVECKSLWHYVELRRYSTGLRNG